MKRNYLMWLIGGAALYFITRKKAVEPSTDLGAFFAIRKYNAPAPIAHINQFFFIFLNSLQFTNCHVIN